MKNIVTISRQYGSGGRDVGKLVAERLGYAFYDKELIRRVAKLGDIDVDLVSTGGEGLMGKISAALAHSHVGAVDGDLEGLPLSDRLFLVESRTVKQIADEGPCVIIGHCGDYFLAERNDVINVFIVAEWESRVERIMERNGLERHEAMTRIKKIDRNRASFYETFTERKWGRVGNYDLCLSTSALGIEAAAALIAEAARIMQS
jgi:cytidylate kinase